ncbi:MAG: gluconokinase [Betaproteobacteria bacterium]
MIVALMGVSGAGKTTVGKLLSKRLGWPLLDADDFHPPANIEKMRSGIPLTDEDRWPWLDRLNGLLRETESNGESALLACSALKSKYRQRLAAGCSDLRWVYLKGSFELIESRLKVRKGHYMKAGLLESQFAALEEPVDAITADIDATPEAIADVLQKTFSPQRRKERKEKRK